ncbi:MAG: Integrase catalytic region [candidate division NC10 bacterium]|nr:Integrase catalytic region [candidate division NC10 bacterium]MBM2836677.1 Integrase catalytic region [candidate division NC10 bacterium]
MNYLRDLIHRLRLGQSERQIARDLHLSRQTVSKYRELTREAGYLESATELPDVATLSALLGPPLALPRTPSTVEPYQQLVEELLAQDVEMMTIFDRLTERGYTGSYSSIRRFVHRLHPPEDQAVVRVHTAPGEEAQVDFGSAGPFLDPGSGRLRTAYVFVMTLCYSRHQYAELVFDQKIPTWISCHRHAFEWFAGVVRRVVPDNLKAAVLEASLYDPVLGEPYRRMAQHYGFLVSPTRPRTPEHKGKVENGVHFVKRSFLAGQTFTDIREANRRLLTWITERAGTRDHGTTHRPPLALFRAAEQQALLPLPAEPFALVETRRLKLHPDCHVVIDGSFYSAPFQHIGKQLDAYIFERVVQLFLGVDLVVTHPRAIVRGEWHTRNEDYPPEKAQYLIQTPAYCRTLARRIGPSTLMVVEQLLAERPLDRLRAAQGILGLADTVGKRRLEAACRRALFYGGAVTYRRIKEILNGALDQVPLPDQKPERPSQMRFLFARDAAEFFGEVEPA